MLRLSFVSFVPFYPVFCSVPRRRVIRPCAGAVPCRIAHIRGCSLGPVSAAGVVERSRFATVVRIDAAVLEDRAPKHPRADGPAGQCDAVPRGPAALCRLVLVADRGGLLQVDQYEIGVVAFGEAALVDDVPDAGRGIA